MSLSGCFILVLLNRLLISSLAVSYEMSHAGFGSMYGNVRLSLKSISVSSFPTMLEQCCMRTSVNMEKNN